MGDTAFAALAKRRLVLRRFRPGKRDGWRYQAFIANTATGQLAFWRPVTALMPGSRTGSGTPKDSGLGRFPSREFAINQAWLSAVMIAADLIAGLRLLALSGSLAKAEPKAMRYRILHTPARLIRSARRKVLRLPDSWPWTDDIIAVFARIGAIPTP